VSARLTGQGILVTRPVDQCTRLAQLIRNAGGEPLLFPAMEIEALPDATFSSAVSRLGHIDIMVFVSPSAVRAGLPGILRHGGIGDRIKVAAVGPGTAAELKRNGVKNIISPKNGFDSEALLDEFSGMDLEGVRALIVRGQGGREFLPQHLRARGAMVDYFECYRAVKPQRDMRELVGRDGIRACLATSSKIVENLFEMAGMTEIAWLRGIPFFVPHPRVAATAFELGAQCVFVAGSGDEALVAALQTWFARLRGANVSS
jgi:uroporphyrinogen-III synthase